MEENLKLFVEYLVIERGLAENTQKAYGHDLEAFISYLPEQATSFSVEDVIDYMAYLHKKGYSEQTRARALIAIKVFCRFLFREDIFDKDIGKFLDTPKLWQTLPEILTPGEVQRLLSSPDITTDQGKRDSALLELLYATGMRVSELCRLSITDVDDDQIRLFGKGDKERIVPVSKRAMQAVDRYLVHVRDRFDSEHEIHLFLTQKGKPIDRVQVWRLVKQYAKNVAIEKNIYPHLLRHSFASHLLDHGADLRVIQEMLGHAHISSTDRYTHVSLSRLQEHFKNCHPRW